MATTKKATTTAKVTKAKKAPVKKSAPKAKKPAKVEHRTLRRSTDNTPFFTLRLTHQTLYWLILAGLVIALAAWVMHLSGRIQDIYDQIDAADTGQVYVLPKKSSAPAQ